LQIEPFWVQQVPVAQTFVAPIVVFPCFVGETVSNDISADSRASGLAAVVTFMVALLCVVVDEGGRLGGRIFDIQSRANRVPAREKPLD
jgi:hypothetical protein